MSMRFVQMGPQCAWLPFVVISRVRYSIDRRPRAVGNLGLNIQLPSGLERQKSKSPRQRLLILDFNLPISYLDDN